jgi:hypothetical protein
MWKPKEPARCSMDTTTPCTVWEVRLAPAKNHQGSKSGQVNRNKQYRTDCN